jgi:hypothetical protein
VVIEWLVVVETIDRRPEATTTTTREVTNDMKRKKSIDIKIKIIEGSVSPATM